MGRKQLLVESADPRSLHACIHPEIDPPSPSPRCYSSLKLKHPIGRTQLLFESADSRSLHACIHSEIDVFRR